MHVFSCRTRKEDSDLADKSQVLLSSLVCREVRLNGFIRGSQKFYLVIYESGVWLAPRQRQAKLASDTIAETALGKIPL